jgi:Ca2+-transporting ATPase
VSVFYNKSPQATLRELDATDTGLAGIDANERLKEYGPNSIRVKSDPLWRKLVEPFANIFMLVLFVAAIISIYHGEQLDALIIVIIMAISAGIYYVQRLSTDRILNALQQHTVQLVETLRDGKTIKIETTELVPGDIIMLSEGEKIPADARLLYATNVRADEALLTGESVPISKQTETLRGDKEIYEQNNMLFQGSFIVAGEATAVVTDTGNATEFGKLAVLASDNETTSPVQRKIDKLISQIIAVVGAMAVVAFGLSLLRGMELTDTIRFVMALSVSAVPESLPVAISVILVLGMRRMAARKALVRNMRAIESVGATTTIATDKTGTLTKNKLTVQAIWQPEHSHQHVKDFIQKTINQGQHNTHDPLDIALIEYAKQQKIPADSGMLLATLPFDQAVAMSGNMWQHGINYALTVKGAPEHILQRSQLTSGEHEHAITTLHQLTGNGYRVIALAQTTLGKPIMRFEDLPHHAKFEFVGFVAVADVLRPEAKRAVRMALDAGVTVRMITGDHMETAYHIAKELGMVTSREQVFDSRHMNIMSDEQLDHAIRDVRVFSRVTPEHKFRILELLKRHHITAMTGDGVNDVPALTNAHVGVAMGSGSQIAKDAGDIILLDDNFKSIIEAIHEGRVIINNIRRMLYYLLATNAGEALTMMGALVVGIPLPLVPVQILWINLVTDSAMVIPLGLEPGEKHIMQHPPKHPNSPILSKYIVTRMVLVAFSMAAMTLGMYAYFQNLYGHEYARTIAFAALVVMQWSNAINARSDYQSLLGRLRVWSSPFALGMTVAVILQTMALFGPLQSVVHVTPVAIGDLFITGLIAFFVPIILVEAHKFVGRRRHLIIRTAQQNS